MFKIAIIDGIVNKKRLNTIDSFLEKKYEKIL